MNTSKLDEHYKSTYDSEAGSYDESRFGTLRGGFAMRYKNEIALSLLERYGLLCEKSRALDCPSGTGRITRALAESSIGRIDAVDISSEMLNINQQNLRIGGDRVTYSVANMKQLPFENETFDAAVVSGFFYLVPLDEYSQYVADIYRVLKPGGIIVVEFANAFPACSPRSFASVVKRRFLAKDRVKSYVSPWQIRRLLKPFVVLAIRGTEYPLLGSSYSFYRSFNHALGRVPPLRWICGKHTIAACKPKQ